MIVEHTFNVSLKAIWMGKLGLKKMGPTSVPT
jgi:hypothetical protein